MMSTACMNFTVATQQEHQQSFCLLCQCVNTMRVHRLPSPTRTTLLLCFSQGSKETNVKYHSGILSIPTESGLSGAGGETQAEYSGAGEEILTGMLCHHHTKINTVESGPLDQTVQLDFHIFLLFHFFICPPTPCQGLIPKSGCATCLYKRSSFSRAQSVLIPHKLTLDQRQTS